MRQVVRAKRLCALVLFCVSCVLYSGETLQEDFSGKTLNEKVWEKGGKNKPLQNVHDGSLRLVSNGKGNDAFVRTKSGGFNFYKNPVTIIWDIIPERTLIGPHPNTRNSKAYAGLSLGGRKGTMAELGLATWPEGYPKPKENASWYYTIDLGTLTPDRPKKDLRLSGVPRRITWILDDKNVTVKIQGAKFVNGNATKRTVPHGLSEAKFTDGFHLKIYTSSEEKSMEQGSDHISGVVYTDQLLINKSAPYTDSTVAPIPGYKEMLKLLAGENIPTSCPPQYSIGLNYAGGNFRKDTFRVPPPESLDYFKSKGILLMRLPIKWERIQPELMGELDPLYLANVKKTIALMAERKMKVILDLHNYGQYQNKKTIGTEAVPYEAFRDIWKRLAIEFKDEPSLWGYGLMNEPFKLPKTWGKAAQAAVDGIRSVDKKTTIVVGGYGFSGSRNWEKDSGKLLKEVKDPNKNLCYEAHCYYDHNYSGKFKYSYEYEINRPGARLHAKTAEERLKSFVNWLNKNKLKGLIGETAVPANPDRDPRWLVVLDNAYRYLKSNKVPCTYWAAGTLWTRTRCNIIEPFEGKDRPQLTIMLKHAKK